MSKKDLSKADISAKFIAPAVMPLDGTNRPRFSERPTLQGVRSTSCYYKSNIPIAIIEAKDNKHSIGDGMQQAREYADILNVPFVSLSNGDGFVFHDRTGTSPEMESTFALDAFPAQQGRLVLATFQGQLKGTLQVKRTSWSAGLSVTGGGSGSDVTSGTSPLPALLQRNTTSQASMAAARSADGSSGALATTATERTSRVRA